MSVLVGCLVGLAALFADRWVEARRRARALAGVLPAPVSKEPRRLWDRGRSLFGTWPAWAATAGLVGVVLGGMVGLVLGAAAGAGVSLTLARRRTMRSAALRDEQLTDAVRSISAGLRAGLSVTQSLAYAADEAEPPLRRSLRTLVDGLDLGVPLDDSLVAWGEGTDNDDRRLLAGVLRLHRRSGGDLPAVLDQVASTLGERRAAAREVRALTAQARLSGAILGILPIGFFGFLWLTSRRDIEGAFRTPLGVAAVTIGLGLDVVAFLWIRRLLEVR